LPLTSHPRKSDEWVLRSIYKDGAWCTNKNIKRSLFGIGARCCLEFDNKKCELKEERISKPSVISPRPQACVDSFKGVTEKIIDLIFTSVSAECGDGDAVWLSKHKELDEIKQLISDYDAKNKTGWEIKDKGKYLFWGINQEGAIITCDKEFFDSQPRYITLKINY